MKIALSLAFLLLATPLFAGDIQSFSKLEVETPGTDNGEILIDFVDQDSPSLIVNLLVKLGLRSEQYSWFSTEERGVAVRGLSADLLAQLKRRPDIEAVEPNYYMSALYVPNDPYYKYQWHLDLIGMQKAWEYPKGADVIVAVIDTGIAYEKFDQHFRVEDLGDQFVKPYNFVSNNEHANDDHGHGTHVAGTIAQLTNNSVGVAGVAPSVKLMPLKVLNSSGYGTISGIAAAIRYAADNGASVINMSLGGPFPSFILHKAIKYAKNKGVVIVCAAGNSGRSGLSYPANYPECISVSAVRYDKTLTWYSSYGKGLTIAAPGGDMNVDQNEDGLMDGVLQNTINPQDTSQQGYFLFQGTSMAAPHVAAAAALLVSHGVSDPDKVRQILQDSATEVESGSREEYGAGILNVDQSLREVMSRRNWRMLFFAFFLLLAFLAAINRGRQRSEKISFGPLPIIGLLLGCTGFFFLGRLPYLSGIFVLTHPVAYWPWALSGATSSTNPLLFSLVPVLLLTLVFYPWKKLAAVSVGFACGFASFLFYQAFSPTVGIAWVPGAMLECVWLFVNGLLCVGLAVMAAFRLR